MVKKSAKPQKLKKTRSDKAVLEACRSLRPKQRRFLVAYAQCGNMSRTARVTGISFVNHYQTWRQEPLYAKAFAVARRCAVDLLEEEAFRRAVKGCRRPVFYKGARCGYVREYSDSVLQMLLRANKPKKYRERHDINQNTSGEVVVRVVYDERFFGAEAGTTERLDGTDSQAAAAPIADSE